MSDLPNSQNREQAAEPGSPAAKQQAPQPGPHNGTQLPAQSGLGDGAVCYAKAFWEPFAEIQSTIMDILALILLNFGFGIIIAIVAFIGVFIMAKSFFVAVLFLIAAGIPGARLALIPGDHFIASKAPAAFNRAVRQFLEEEST